MRRRSVLLVGVAAVVFVVGCNGGDDAGDVTSGPAPPEIGPDASDGVASGRPAEATAATRCDVGGGPDYYVPGPAARIIGCARLGVSMKPVEFSAQSERFDRQPYVCLNPAYRGRGDRGEPQFYIPNACVRDPISRRLRLIGAEVPNQGVRDYQLVIWGTAAPSTRRVVARNEGGETKAAVFAVRRALARAVGATAPFSVFVVELDSEAPYPVLVCTDDATPPRTKRACDKAEGALGVHPSEQP